MYAFGVERFTHPSNESLVSSHDFCELRPVQILFLIDTMMNVQKKPNTTEVSFVKCRLPEMDKSHHTTWQENQFRQSSLSRIGWFLVESLQWNDDLEEHNHVQIVSEFAR
jgi:hypothetical protein